MLLCLVLGIIYFQLLILFSVYDDMYLQKMSSIIGSFYVQQSLLLTCIRTFSFLYLYLILGH